MKITAYLYTPENDFTGLGVEANIAKRRGGPPIRVGTRTTFKLRHIGAPPALALRPYSVQVRLPVDATDRQRALTVLDEEARDHWHMTIERNI